MNHPQTAHDCPTCTEELVIIDGWNLIFRCDNCEQDYFGGENEDGDEIILGTL